MSGCAPDLRAPFPWFGGKSRAAPVIWERFGDVVNYVEAFAGSLAVLLGRPHEPRIETVNDLDCYLANFWRAMKEAPDEVARWADDPVNEADLHARHVWLVGQVEFRERMLTDPLFFDARIAGWWVWGLCAWIGSGWCDLAAKPSRKLPTLVGGSAEGSAYYGKGIHSGAYRAPSRQLPHMGGTGLDMGRGVHSKGMRNPSRQLPYLGGTFAPGQGIHQEKTRTRIQEVFQALSARLRHTRVACGDFERVLSDSVTWRHGLTGVLLDPEYPEGTQGLYTGKGAKDGEHVWYRAARWAAGHGDDKRLRIALCGYSDTWQAPPGWTEYAWKAKGGYGGQSDGENVNAKRERIWFSPGCVKAEERQLSIDALLARSA